MWPLTCPVAFVRLTQNWAVVITESSGHEQLKIAGEHAKMGHLGMLCFVYFYNVSDKRLSGG